MDLKRKKRNQAFKFSIEKLSIEKSGKYRGQIYLQNNLYEGLGPWVQTWYQLHAS